MNAHFRWLRIMMHGSVGIITIVILLLAIQPVIGWLTFYLNKQLFDHMAGAMIWANLAWIALILAALKLAELLLSEGTRLVQARLSLRIHNRLEHHLYHSVQPTEITHLETSAFAHDTNILKNSLNEIEQSIGSTIGLAQQMLILSVYGYITLTYSWLAAIILLIFSMPLFWVEMLQSLRLEKYFHKVAQNQLETHLASSLILQPQAVKETMIFGSRVYLLNKWTEAAESVIRKTNALKYGDFRTRSIAIIFQPIGFLLIQLILFNKLVNHQITLGDYAALSTASMTVYSSMLMIAGYSRIFKQIPLATKNFQSFINKYILTAKEHPVFKMDPIHTIVLSQLSFTYPHVDRPALRHINMTVAMGDVVAIVGENGSGKSTMAKVLLGLHKIEHGMLFINGRDINQMDRDSWFDQVSIVNQDYMRYPFSIYENIALDHPNEEVKHKVERLIQAYPMLVPSELHHKLETYLGNHLQGARQLSGGQWQRIAIARALYKDSPFLLLDEATSELDPSSEIGLIQQILSDRRLKTTVMVTHNLAVAAMAPRIIVMQEGEIVESGSHEALMERKGQYFKMWNTQHSHEGDNIHEQSYVSGII